VLVSCTSCGPEHRSAIPTRSLLCEITRSSFRHAESVVFDVDQANRSEVAEACDAAAIAESLTALDGGLRADSWPLAVGRLVVTGEGFYVNRALAVGLTEAVTPDDLRFAEERCQATGVPPELEVCPWADPSLLEAAVDRGYVPVWFRTVLVRSLSSAITAPSMGSDVDIEPVQNDNDFDIWLRTTVAGNRIGAPRQQHVARCWGRALRRLDKDRLHIARLDGTPIAVASLAIQNGVALLGGMTTVPKARRLGTQQRLISFRLQRAVDLGCDLAVSAAEPGSASERNLQRSGFEILGTKLCLRLQMHAGT
jgi:hypothetical protein